MPWTFEYYLSDSRVIGMRQTRSHNDDTFISAVCRVYSACRWGIVNPSPSTGDSDITDPPKTI